jgi:hypothetical protein
VPLEPFDVADTADALARALAGESVPDQERRADWRHRIGSERAVDWLSAVLAECDGGHVGI